MIPAGFRNFLVAACFALATASTGYPAKAASSFVPTIQASLAPMLERVLPTVVIITVQGRNESPAGGPDSSSQQFSALADEAPQTQTAGAGVIIDAANGYVLTNNHVVQNGDEITVTLNDGRSFQAEPVGNDAETDLAVIRIPAHDLTALPFGDSSQLRVGDYVVAIGNPFGLGQTATMGIVSALGRSGPGGGYEKLIQTDASINPGNSGGPLVGLDGNLVGINSAIIGPSGGNVGIGFAIPAAMAKQITEQLIAHGKVRRVQLGVVVQDLTADLAKAFGADIRSGAVVNQILLGSVAEGAGVHVGDIITAVNGASVENAAGLKNIMSTMSPDAPAKLSMIRHGNPTTVTTKLSAEGSPGVTQIEGSGLLASVVLSDVETITGVGNKKVDGALVLTVGAGSGAGDAGLAADDVILTINQQIVHSPGQALELAQRSPAPLLLGVYRNGGMYFLTVQ
ncbi:trypsin-like peptidase domain-containing protein [Mesorhizobium jarvisii]|uniref:trypsin-like peptidase domain-containing protein n=1 Tax=Mesorhizobium jarvisii TaxID=1777867 RepID=UPI001F0B5EC5|nr:trypsin-like peptidase domain-containing protein [Mesorhizobium jarvisii]MCH4561149.1 trypsin-like peptidase domain-containing protein [Mesorhizobium jarvisii]